MLPMETAECKRNVEKNKHAEENYCKVEGNALLALTKDEDLTTLPADRCQSTAVMNTND
jgi:hypothetical protein